MLFLKKAYQYTHKTLFFKAKSSLLKLYSMLSVAYTRILQRHQNTVKQGFV